MLSGISLHFVNSSLLWELTIVQYVFLILHSIHQGISLVRPNVNRLSNSSQISSLNHFV